ncbi:MAG: DUF3307 domain-containing protein [Rhizobiaceae bacterium]
MDIFAFLILVGLQAKHFAADYLLQPRWMIMGKTSFAKPGGYVHVAIHAVGSLLVLMTAEVPAFLIALLIVAEAAAHYLIDYVKARWSLAYPSDPAKRSYWAAHGADQFMHQLTYAAMLFVVLWYMGGG